MDLRSIPSPSCRWFEPFGRQHHSGGWNISILEMGWKHVAWFSCESAQRECCYLLYHNFVRIFSSTKERQAEAKETVESLSIDEQDVLNDNLLSHVGYHQGSCCTIHIYVRSRSSFIFSGYFQAEGIFATTSAHLSSLPDSQSSIYERRATEHASSNLSLFSASHQNRVHGPIRM